MNTTISLVTKARNGDRASEEKLIRENISLVHSCVRKFVYTDLEYDDLLQLGCIGLVKAIRRFDTGFGVAFSTYAVPLIMGEVRRFIRDDGIIKVSRSLKEIKNKAAMASHELSLALNREPTITEIASHIGVDTEKLVMAMEACLPCDSLQRCISSDTEGDITLGDTVKDGTMPGIEFDKLSLKLALESLNDRDKKIIILRYFRGKTQAEVSKLIGVSQVQISRIEKKVLAHLSEKLS